MLKDNLEIVLATYNRKESLKSTLESLFSESSPVKECDITILDNCSEDGTMELCQEYAKKHPNLKHVRRTKNIGGLANVALAFEIPLKKYLWVLCDDDAYDWSRFDEIEQAIKEDYDLIYTVLGSSGKINNLAEAFYIGAFVPAFICKTSNITTSVMDNIMFNVSNFFPHLCVVAKVLNDDKKIFYPSHSTVFRGVANDNPQTFVRGLVNTDLSPLRRNMFWLLGYINCVQMIEDKTKRDFIIDNLRYNHDSLFELFLSNIHMNNFYYDGYFRNLVSIFMGLNFGQRLLFLKAFTVSRFEALYIKEYLSKPCSKENWMNYFELVNQEKKLKQFLKKYKNKKVVIYGLGMIMDILFEKYDLGRFNIVVVADRKFQKGDKFRDYDGISMQDIPKYNPDVVFICNYQDAHIKKALMDAGIKVKTEHILSKRKSIHLLKF